MIGGGRRWLVPVVVLAAGCTELPAIATGVCGNGIVEPGEDCDQRDSAACSNCYWMCKSDTPNECQNEAVGYLCAADGVCYGPSGDFAQTPADVSAYPVLGFRILDIDLDGIGDVVGLNATAMNVRYGDASGRLVDTYNLVTPQVQGNPQVTALVAPNVPDLVIPTADGLVVYTAAFGLPTPRQYPLGGSQGPENMGGRPDPFDAVQVRDTIGLFGPSSDAGAVSPLRFGLIAVADVGPIFDVETTQLCEDSLGAPMEVPAGTRVVNIANYEAPTGTFISFSTGTLTCVIEIRPRAEVPRAIGTDCLPSYPNTPGCRSEVKTVTTFNRFMSRAVFADVDGDGCPSLFDQDAGLGAVREYPGTTSIDGCVIANVPRSETLRVVDPPASVLLGSVKLEPAVDEHAPDALISAYGIHALPTTVSPTDWRTKPLFVSDRPLERAVRGDIDNDGALDVVFSTEQLPNLDIARRVPGEDYFLLVRTPTTGAVVRTIFSDYDGDGRDDLAYVERLGTAQRLSIAYGSPTGLGAAVPADVFENIAFLARIRVRDSTDPFDLVDDLIAIDLIGTSPQDLEPEITLLHGSPSRTMLSFFGTPVAPPQSAFRGVVGGHFIDHTPADTTDRQLVDLVAFQTFRRDASDPTPCTSADCKTALWVVPGLPRARLGDAQFTIDLGMGDFRLPSAPAVGDCNATTLSDFCVQSSKLLAWKIGDERDIVLGIDFRGAQPASLLRFDPAVPWGQGVNTQPVTLNAFAKYSGTGHIHELFAFDIDHDGQEELIAPFGSTTFGGVDGFTLICRMNRDGTFAGDCIDVASQILNDAELRCVDAEFGRVLPVCDGEYDGTVDHLAVLCRKPIADPESQQTRWQSVVVPIVSDGSGGFTTPTGEDRRPILTVNAKVDEIQLGDVTGDALADIVALDITSGTAVLAVFAQHTTHEAPVCHATLLPQ